MRLRHHDCEQAWGPHAERRATRLISRKVEESSTGTCPHSYERQGVSELAYNKLGHLLQARYGSTTDASQKLDDMGAIGSAFKAVRRFLYLS